MELITNKIKLMVVVMILPLIFKTQNTIYKEVYNYNTKIESKNSGTDKTIITYNSGYVYGVSQNSAFDTNELIIKEYDTKTKKTKSLVIKKSKDLKNLFNEHIDAIGIVKNKLVIVNYKYIFIFIKNNQEYTLQKSIKNNGSFNRVYPLTNNELLLYVNYNFHPLDELDKHTWSKLYIDKDSLGAEKRMDDENVLFSYFVNEWISTYKGLIAYAHTTDYTIKLYNDNLVQIDSIKSNYLEKNKSGLKLLPIGDDHSVDEMNKISKADDTLLTRIEKVFLLDSIHILATLKQPNTSHLKYDLWKKTITGWSLIKSQDLPGYYEEGIEYTPENNYVKGFYGNYAGLVYADNNDFYFIYFPFMENVISKSYNRQTDYYDKENELARKKELYYGIKKIKILTN